MSKNYYQQFIKWIEKEGLENTLGMYSAYLQGRTDAVEELAKAHNIRVEDD